MRTCALGAAESAGLTSRCTPLRRLRGPQTWTLWRASTLRMQRCAPTYLKGEVTRLRQSGDLRRAEFFDDCASRIVPVLVTEFPEGLFGEQLNTSDIQSLTDQW